MSFVPHIIKNDMTSLPVGSAGSLTSAPIRAFFVTCFILRVIVCNFLKGQNRNNRRVTALVRF